MEEAAIRLGSGIGIGKIRLDPTEIKGEGDEYDPRLVIPIKIELNQQPLEHTIVIVRLSASLHLNQSPAQSNQFGARASYDLIYNMPIRSVPNGVSDTPLELRFNLTHAQLKALENMRHQPGENLYLCLDPIIAWAKHTGNSDDRMFGGISTLGDGKWDIRVGLFSDFAFFWLPKIDTLRLDLSAMDWAKKIFPGLGYDYYRLVEVKLPVSDVLVPKEAVEHFKEAKQDYDKGMYPECIMKCRLVHEAIEKHLKVRSGPDHELGKAVTQALGWTPTSEQEKFLDGAWKALYVIANASAHTPSVKSLLPADAHMVLISTAAMLEYLAQLE